MDDETTTRRRRAVTRIVLGIYNILATYLLGWVLFIAGVSVGLYAFTDVIAGLLDFESTGALWQYVDHNLVVDSIYWRVGIYGLLHAAIIYFGRPVLQKVQAGVEKGFDAVAELFSNVTEKRPRIEVVGRLLFTLAVTVVLVPFVIQPTMVSGTSADSWAERTANLVDGTASRYVVDSVAGMYRRYLVDDVESYGGVGGEDVSDFDDRDGATSEVDEDVDPDPPPKPVGERPMMDRWDPVIETVTDGNARDFAYVKAFMYVESSGRQFAVSHTGCAGLMQFCSGTARQSPYRSIFGRGSVYPCGCQPDCETPQPVVEALETGNRDQISNLDEQFPCELTDARFDGKRSIRAGTKFIQKLADNYDGNLYLMYIGYNSGPGVANEVWRRIERDAEVGLETIERHLEEALRPHFDDAASSRARSLTNTHLPRLRRAYDRYYESEAMTMDMPPQRGAGDHGVCKLDRSG